MKHLTLCAVFLMSFGLFANDPIKQPVIPNLHKFSSPKLEITEGDTSLLILEMSFNGFVPVSKLQKIPVDRIESVTLAYSRYRLSESFDQMSLNMQRMDKLYAELPGLKNNKDVLWFWVEQTGCSDAESCKDYFHGFIIKLRSEESLFYRETEIALMEYYTSIYEGLSDSRIMDSLIATGKTTYIKKCDTMTLRSLIKGNKLPKVRGWDRDYNETVAKLLKEELAKEDTIEFSVNMNDDGEFVSLDELEKFIKGKKLGKYLKNRLAVAPGKENRKKVASKVYAQIFKNKGSYKINFKAYPVIEEELITDIDKFLYVSNVQMVCDYLDTSIIKVGKGIMSSTPDVVIKVLDRNKTWKNCLVATDVTGSMYPYLAQFQMWHKLNLDQNAGNHDFIFFNDGDNKPDLIKVNGSVGGLYYIKTSNFEELSVTMKKAMLRGGGGDRPENNVEAVLEGLKKNPSIREVIMIADNFATPRDMELLKQVKVPIHLILCGIHTAKGINPAYLDLVRKTKGSIHTMTEDLYDLSKLNEGQSVKIDGKTYKLIKGEFIKV